MKRKWIAFPQARAAFGYRAAALKKHWPRLHRGDCEPFPAGEDEREAWRAFHAGEFQRAWEEGSKLGPPGMTAACKAAATYASYLERDNKHAASLLDAAAELGEQACKQAPDHANAQYMLAYCLGRYAQKVSVTRALADGLAGRVQRALERTLALEPKHAEAHVATGTYHAEVIDKVGSLLGGLTYGASADEALKHYRRGLSLFPESAIVRIEYARGLLMLDASRTSEARKLLAQAAKCDPADAAETLDVAHAKAKLEALQE